MVFLSISYCLRDLLSILRVHVAMEIFRAADVRIGGDSEHRFQVTKPRILAASNVPLPSDSFAGFHRRTKPVIGNNQLRFHLSPFRSLPQQPKNEQGLGQTQRNAPDDVAPIRPPDTWLPV